MLTVGTNVFTQERIVTGERGQTQMLFLDESALTIGPNSDMVLDEFVYDPDAQTGSLVINATKGVFRLVGGKISKKNPVLLKTPTATPAATSAMAKTRARRRFCGTARPATTSARRWCLFRVMARARSQRRA